MSTKPDLESIPRGNTCPGVNRAVIEFLLNDDNVTESFRLLDIPCGNGELLNSVRKFFPACQIEGADAVVAKDRLSFPFSQVDVRQPLAESIAGPFDVITCISGVMEFDNTLQFFLQLRDLVSAGGRLIVSNDNLLSIRDRLLYLCFGRFRQFHLFPEPDQSTWKVLTLQNLLRVLTDAGFSAEHITYLPPRWTEYLFLPLALPVWLAQSLYRNRTRSTIAASWRREMFPFRSLFSRHYLVICRVPIDFPIGSEQTGRS